MKFFMLAALPMLMCSWQAAQAQREVSSIEVTGMANVEVEPDEIHYVIEIKEYFEGEFAGVPKPEGKKPDEKMPEDKKPEGKNPEDNRTKVQIATIEENLKQALQKAGIKDKNVQVQQLGNHWRAKGEDFLIAKRYDIKVSKFSDIDAIIENLDTRGVNMMRIAEMKNKKLPELIDKAKAEALKDAKRKAEYMAEALGVTVGRVISVVEPSGEPGFARNVIGDAHGKGKDAPMQNLSAGMPSYDQVKTIKQTCTMRVRFELVNEATEESSTRTRGMDVNPNIDSGPMGMPFPGGMHGN